MKRLQIVFCFLWIGLFAISVQAQPSLPQQELDKQLILAVKYEHENIAETLITAGADTNVSDADGFYPIHYAVRNGNSSLVRILIRAGADTNISDADGFYPIHYAVRNGNFSSVRILIRAGAYLDVLQPDGDFPIHIALKLGFRIYPAKDDIIDELLDANVELNVPNADGFYPIHLATIYGRHKIEDLLEAGANPNTRIPVQDSINPVIRSLSPLDLLVYYHQGGRLFLHQFTEIPETHRENFDVYDLKNMLCRAYNLDPLPRSWVTGGWSAINRLLQDNASRINCR